jgi:two-component system sensor histidine kinase HydH
MGARRDSGRLVVWVRDSGTGVSEGETGRLFDLFYSSKRGGTGLGLPIAQRIVEAHGGRLEWKNNEREGAEFSMILSL